MPYGRVYISNLRSKVTALFDELRADNRLCKKTFIEAFKTKYPKDYATLEWEWDYKIHEFKKNRKGHPKHFPIRPDEILSNMYKNYYYKLVKKPIIKQNKEKSVNIIRCVVGKYGYRVKQVGSNAYDVINKKSMVVSGSFNYSDLKAWAKELIQDETDNIK